MFNFSLIKGSVHNLCQKLRNGSFKNLKKKIFLKKKLYKCRLQKEGGGKSGIKIIDIILGRPFTLLKLNLYNKNSLKNSKTSKLKLKFEDKTRDFKKIVF